MTPEQDRAPVEVLKPCPFCGESLVCDPNEGAPFWVHHNRMKSDCWLADSWVKDEAEGEGGILEWNTRAPALAATPFQPTDAGAAGHG